MYSYITRILTTIPARLEARGGMSDPSHRIRHGEENAAVRVASQRFIHPISRAWRRRRIQDLEWMYLHCGQEAYRVKIDY